MARDKTMKALWASIEAKEAEISRLTAQVEALKDVYNSEAGIVQEKKPRAARSNVKNTVFGFLDRVESSGLNAAKACEMARLEGIDLNPKSVSSLLSRFAKDGVLHYDGHVYRLLKFAPKEPLDIRKNITPIRTSGHPPQRY